MRLALLLTLITTTSCPFGDEGTGEPDDEPFALSASCTPSQLMVGEQGTVRLRVRFAGPSWSETQPAVVTLEATRGVVDPTQLQLGGDPEHEATFTAAAEGTAVVTVGWHLVTGDEEVTCTFDVEPSHADAGVVDAAPTDGTVPSCADLGGVALLLGVEHLACSTAWVQEGVTLELNGVAGTEYCAGSACAATGDSGYLRLAPARLSADLSGLGCAASRVEVDVVTSMWGATAELLGPDGPVAAVSDLSNGTSVIEAPPGSFDTIQIDGCATTISAIRID